MCKFSDYKHLNFTTTHIRTTLYMSNDMWLAKYIASYPVAI